MIRFENGKDGLPQIVLTKGQGELIQAADACGISNFQIRSADEGLTTITINTKMRFGCSVAITANWWGTGRFRGCWIETVGLQPDQTQQTQSLSKAIDVLKVLASLDTKPETSGAGRKKVSRGKGKV